MTRPPYTYFNIGSTGAQFSEPTTLSKAELQERTIVVEKYRNIKFQNLLTVVVNYHVEGIINGIIQILINNTGQTKHMYFLQVPPGKVMDEIVYNLSSISYDTVKVQAVPLILGILQKKFPDSDIKSDASLSYIIVDWS
jgi:hypothetical protein